MRRGVAVIVMLGLAACTVGNEEARTIDIQNSTVEPASVLVNNIDGLLAKTAPSYVTLVVHDGTTEEIARAENRMTDAVTSGSGFVIDTSGHVLTAGHVAIAVGWRVLAKGPGGHNYKGRVEKILKSNDMALVKLERPSGLQPVTPADQPCLKVGEGIFSLGKPRKLGDTARLGEVASMSFGRAVSYDQFGYPDAMVLKLETRKGESGGPVFDSVGRLTGMLVSTLSDSSGRHLNLAHAIPIPDLARFVCDGIDCSPQWRALSKVTTKSCPATRVSRKN